ncbi:MAG: phosphatase PAP2 family protein [Vicinamibacteria bacterium]
MSEADVLLWIHQWANPWLDGFFRVSHDLGRMVVLLAIAGAVVGWHAGEKRWRRAGAWLVLALMTVALLHGMKYLIARDRPQLWPRLMEQGGESFPSGHALGSAALFTLVAWEVSQRRPKQRAVFYAIAVAGSLWLGFGRLYLGVHWPSDVVAGWVLGASIAAGGIALLTRLDEGERPARGTSTNGSKAG